MSIYYTVILPVGWQPSQLGLGVTFTVPSICWWGFQYSSQNNQRTVVTFPATFQLADNKREFQTMISIIYWYPIKSVFRLGLYIVHRLVINLLFTQVTPGGCHGLERTLVLGVTVQEDFDTIGEKKSKSMKLGFFVIYIQQTASSVVYCPKTMSLQPVVHLVINWMTLMSTWLTVVALCRLLLLSANSLKRPKPTMNIHYQVFTVQPKPVIAYVSVS